MTPRRTPMAAGPFLAILLSILVAGPAHARSGQSNFLHAPWGNDEHTNQALQIVDGCLGSILGPSPACLAPVFNCNWASTAGCTFTGNAAVSSALTVGGLATASGVLTGTLGVTGAVTLASTLTLTAPAAGTNALIIKAKTGVNNTLQSWQDNAGIEGASMTSAGDLSANTGVFGLGGLATTGTFAALGASVALGGNISVAEGKNIALGTTTGTKLATATSQKLAFWNATPVVQPTVGDPVTTLQTLGLMGAGTPVNSPTAHYARLREDPEALNNGANNDLQVIGSLVVITGPSAGFSISGIITDPANTGGQVVTLLNTTTQAMTISNETTSTATNRIHTSTGADLVTTGEGSVTLIYDSAATRWRDLEFRP